MVERVRHGRASAATGQLRLRLLGLGAGLVALLAASPVSRDVQAAGETRTLSFFHTHTNETATVTFRRNGAYDEDGLKQLNWLLRDWRVSEPAKMDPRLFDILWEVYRESGSREPIHVISAYRSPATNSMLRRASGGVAENSQHIAGKAMDIRLPDVDTARLREIAMRLQYGGVGFYSSSKFVHVDTGSVRAWPRMSQDQLARLFPDGKTLHLPANGGPLPGYELAKAEILPRNASLAGQGSSGGSGSIATALADLFRGKADQPAPTVTASAARPAPAQPGNTGSAVQPAVTPLPAQVAAYAPVAAASAGLVPLPPRRPAERPVMVASAEPVALPGPAPAGGSPRAAATDEAAAVRALFAHTALHAAPRQAPRIHLAQVRVAPAPAPAALDLNPSPLAGRFSPATAGALEVARFTGPAVRPLGVIRTADAAF